MEASRISGTSGIGREGESAPMAEARSLAFSPQKFVNLPGVRSPLLKIGYCLTISMSGIFQLLSKSDLSGP